MTQIRQRPAGRPGAEYDAENVLMEQQKNTTRRADSITFYLPINDRYRLTADERCWRIEQRRKNVEWRPIEYHTTIESAVNSLARRLVRTSEVRTPADALAAIEDAARTVTLALAPRVTVERWP